MPAITRAPHSCAWEPQSVDEGSPFMSHCSQSLVHASSISMVTEDFQVRGNLFFLSKGKKENISLNGSFSNTGID